MWSIKSICVVTLTALETLDEVFALLLAADTHVLLLLTGVGALVVSLGWCLLSLSRGRAATTEKHVGETVTHGRADSDTSGGGGHLTEETGTRRLLCHSRLLLCVCLRRLLVLLLLRGGHGVSTSRAR